MHNALPRCLAGFILASLLSTVGAAQTLSLKSVFKSATVSAEDLQDMPRVKVRVTLHGKRHTFEGVPLSALLRTVDAPQGERLRGQALTNAVIVRARDGYEIIFALAETDPSVAKGAVILADRMDGKPLDAKEGPFRVIVQADLKPARSAKMVESIELKSVGSR